ncbi:MAG: hypothetical protein ACO307_11760, partial [Ilumatobacteraceae bacterium]
MSVIDLTHLADVELPTADAEIWRYSRIGELDLAKFTPTEHHVDVADVEDLVAATGIVDLFGEAPDVFAGLNRSAGRTLHLVVPPRTTVADPIVITHRVPGGGALSTPRLVVEVGVDAEVTVIERFVSASEGPALTLPVLQVRAAAASRVRYLAVNELSPEAWSIGHQQTESDRDSSLLL